MGYEIPHGIVGCFPADIDMSTRATWQFAPVWVGAAANVVGYGAGGAALKAQGSRTDPPFGILQNTPLQGSPGSVVTAGITKCIIGGTVAVGDPVAAVAGAVVKATAAGGKFAFGRALEAGVANDVIAVEIRPLGIQ